jgi:hypothetical protein
MSLEAILVLAWLPIPILSALFWHARVYSLYQSLGERVGHLSYLAFIFRFRNPWLARRLPGDFYRSLPEGLAAQVSSVRRQTRWAESICGVLDAYCASDCCAFVSALVGKRGR